MDNDNIGEYCRDTSGKFDPHKKGDKQRTPIGELIELYKHKIKTINDMLKVGDKNDETTVRLINKRSVFRSVIVDLERANPAEREEIEQAYRSGTYFKSVNSMTTTVQRRSRAINYFTTKYETE